MDFECSTVDFECVLRDFECVLRDFECVLRDFECSDTLSALLAVRLRGCPLYTYIPILENLNF